MFIDMLQRVLDTLGINVQFQLPYRFKTKGEMMRECLDQDLLQKWAADSTSCGRFRTYNRQHCGRCVPCLIRRAAFLAWIPEGIQHLTALSLLLAVINQVHPMILWLLHLPSLM